MKHALIIGFVFFMLGCETDFKIVSESNPIPIVYCILNPAEEIQTIRLTKTYKNRESHSKPDSMELMYFQSKVDLAIEPMENGEAVDQIKFTPFQVKKETGYFSNDYHIVYQANMAIQPQRAYRLVIHLQEEDRLLYSIVNTPGEFQIIDPSFPDLRTLNIISDHNPVFNWTVAKNSGIYELGFIIDYFESDSIGSKLISENISLRIVNRRDNPISFYSSSINSTQFYKRLGEAIKPDNNLVRTFHNLDAFIIAGGDELAHYYQNQFQGNSFTLTEYSNIQNGIGLFSSVSYSYSRGFKVSGQTLDSLAYGQFTKQLNFLDRHGNRKTQ